MGFLETIVATLAAGSALLGTTLAHPGEEHSAEHVRKSLAAREVAVAHATQVSKCAASPRHAALQQRAVARRALTAQLLREKRNIVDKPMVHRRDQASVDKWINTCHDMTSAYSTDLATAEASIFGSKNATSALTPETIVGPYFVAGEVMRRNVTENQAGIPMHVDLQFVDVATCEPVPNMLVDIWHANATGVYSGVAAAGQGGLNSTFLRGVQATDAEGVARYDSVFPGHYVGRTNHVHVASRRGGSVLANGTYRGGTVNHVGQLYFDQELISAVEVMDPYARNTVPLSHNRADFLVGDEATDVYDPFVEYMLLSDDANDGLLVWITIGVNTTADYDALAVPAATYQEGGGKENEGFGAGGPPPGSNAVWKLGIR
ncbi:Intradiol ring-cleavage dioxygenase [Lasiosphaeria miniovina]|uniref:Intradiol ring-cleavage dioxygenase n=1 Tax=Lasiosphaeria miniovina TaxID=1954250 RepID=A0AA40B6Y8_9PEZI|nr:Intradiol ring-cleavage dioxygenase [Lasiosphaeria miniovina]KAK0728830.1 Intradiol ring-cleavage dioxygenase [Lasiosphaeria miniovina]